MIIETNKLIDFTTEFAKDVSNYAPKFIYAFLLLFVGHFSIKIFKRLINIKIKKREFEPTLSKFLINIVIWLLRILLFVTFISKLGIETTSFVAIVGAAGLAIGLSLQGSLSNFAGGILIILFKPFEVGDAIEAQGIAGTVLEIQIFVTKLITSNNQTIFVPNGALSNGNIINHSLEGTRRTDLPISIPYETDLKKVKTLILSILEKNPKVLKEPSPSVDVTALTETSIKLSIRAWANNDDFSSVSSTTLEDCKIKLHDEGILLKA
jgi:small conductance mechanosensitive channel